VTELKKHQEKALLECSNFRPGTYVWYPTAMAELEKKGLTMLVANGSYTLTDAGSKVVREIKERGHV
jgi:sorbitol-specific phosphotransferase system component IIA